MTRALRSSAPRLPALPARPIGAPGVGRRGGCERGHDLRLVNLCDAGDLGHGDEASDASLSMFHQAHGTALAPSLARVSLRNMPQGRFVGRVPISRQITLRQSHLSEPIPKGAWTLPSRNSRRIHRNRMCGPGPDLPRRSHRNVSSAPAFRHRTPTVYRTLSQHFPGGGAYEIGGVSIKTTTTLRDTQEKEHEKNSHVRIVRAVGDCSTQRRSRRHLWWWRGSGSAWPLLDRIRFQERLSKKGLHRERKQEREASWPGRFRVDHENSIWWGRIACRKRLGPGIRPARQWRCQERRTSP